MRLARLDLVRYGKFTGRTLHFGARPVGGPDLHIVYGPNEAGKSTAFSAFLDLLYGIRATKEPNYAFLHPYPTLRIGALLELAGGDRELVRIRRAQATLLDADDRPLDEGLLAAELGGIGRDGYRGMFSLDDESLEQGGEEILASRGDLGRILFSGSAGAAGLSQALEAMREEADRFFRPGAHKTRLNELKAELDALKAERDATDTQAAGHKRLVDERDRAAAAHDAALKARGDAGVRRDEIARLLGGLPLLARSRSLHDALGPLRAMPEPPAGWSAELPGLERDEVRLGTELQAVRREIEALGLERDAIAVDEAALGCGDAHDALAGLRAAALTAAKDLPRRRPSLAEAEGAVAAHLARLGRPPGTDPDAVALPAALVGTLRELIAERSGVAARREAARLELDTATGDLSAARDALAAAGGAAAAPAAALARLAGTLEAARQADPAGTLRSADRVRAAAEERLAEALRALAPWRGGAEALAGLPLPAARDAEAWASEAAEAEAEAQRRDGEAGDLALDRDALRAQVDALGRVAGPIADAEVLTLRAARDRAWAAHRGRLDAASAEDFEDALRRDDAVAAARFGQAAEVARLREASVRLAELETRLRGAGDRAAAARRRRAAVDDAVAAAAGRLDPPLAGPPTPAGLVAWLARTGPALRAREEARTALEACRAAERDVQDWRDRLAGALAEADVAHDPAGALDGLAGAARAAGAAAAARGALATEFAGAERRLAERAAAGARAEAAETAWEERWAAACRAGWLGETGTEPTPAAVGEVLEVLAALAPDLRTRADLGHRIAAMEADEARFAARLASLAARLGLDAASTGDPAAVLQLDAALERRIREARAAQAARNACAARLAEAEARHARASAAAAGNRARGDVLRAFFGVDTLAEAGARLTLCAERDRLAGEAAALERDIRTSLRVPDFAAAEALLDGLDAAALEAERDAAEGRYAAADGELRTHHASRVGAEAALDAVGGDDAVARMEARRRAVLLDIEDQARRFIKLRGGIAAAELALAAYRDRHRSALLAKASEAFATISRQAYTGLAAQPTDKGEVLIAKARAGGTKQAGDLSKGTRFQLYLALRAAGYHEFAATRRAVPFVADDIMETFDDFRAEEAFRLFAGMAEVGQVIYLTHHRHLIDIARVVCPDVRVHRLDEAAASGEPT
ncbi:YhaN family protein [Lichenibacterium ramalinae]|uniref:YhaN AAA domain-containing protein n=1 Tax=Lichenibacterium ramalinae TaxID=2316527 RepID=A0A4Q2RA35_9HYPH|nr:YhaN family protein [Lichenibacterium ramalinae]RYB03883.1 hypothetical protein D3272_14885 [Lichenibacterium ramalinae]